MTVIGSTYDFRLAQLGATPDHEPLVTPRQARTYVLRPAEVDALLEQLPVESTVLTHDRLTTSAAAITQFCAPGTTSRHRTTPMTSTTITSGLLTLEACTSADGSVTIAERITHVSAIAGLGARHRMHLPNVLRALHRPTTADLEHSLTTVTQRTEVAVAGLHHPDRLVLDRAPLWHAPDGRQLSRPDVCVVTTHSMGRSSIADEILWWHGHTPHRGSLLDIGESALNDDLGSPRWRRFVRHAFGNVA